MHYDVHNVFKLGFLAAESLISLATMLVLFPIFVEFIGKTLHIRVPKITQRDLFQRQMKQLNVRSAMYSFREGRYTIQYDLRKYTVYFDENRIVRSPGYEILLNNVEAFHVMDEGIQYIYDSQTFNVK